MVRQKAFLPNTLLLLVEPENPLDVARVNYKFLVKKAFKCKGNSKVDRIQVEGIVQRSLKIFLIGRDGRTSDGLKMRSFCSSVEQDDYGYDQS